MPLFLLICLIRLAISIALTAASEPLFPALVPALSTACSILSVVRTPKSPEHLKCRLL